MYQKNVFVGCKKRREQVYSALNGRVCTNIGIIFDDKNSWWCAQCPLNRSILYRECESQRCCEDSVAPLSVVLVVLVSRRHVIIRRRKSDRNARAGQGTRYPDKDGCSLLGDEWKVVKTVQLMSTPGAQQQAYKASSIPPSIPSVPLADVVLVL